MKLQMVLNFVTLILMDSEHPLFLRITLTLSSTNSPATDPCVVLTPFTPAQIPSPSQKARFKLVQTTAAVSRTGSRETWRESTLCPGRAWRGREESRYLSRYKLGSFMGQAGTRWKPSAGETLARAVWLARTALWLEEKGREQLLGSCQPKLISPWMVWMPLLIVWVTAVRSGCKETLGRVLRPWCRRGWL